MGTCTSMIDLFGLALIRESIATRWDGRGESWGAGSVEIPERPRVHRNGVFCFPPTLVEKYLELWIIQARGYLQRRLLLQGGYLSYEYYSYRRYGQLAGPS